MSCCEFELLEMSLHRVVMKVKNQHRTGSNGPVPCHLCQGTVEHAFLQRQWIGFSVRISCPHCGWTFEG
jgi:hypothetical protein